MTHTIVPARRRALLGLAGAALGAGLLRPGRILAAGEEAVHVGMLIPLSGPAALFGQSCRNCIELAIREADAHGGIAGRPIAPVFIDAGRAPAEVVADVQAAWRGQRIEAFVGMHDSAVRVALQKLFGGKVCYVYTPNYEGGACQRGVYVLGETPAQLLGPVLPWLAASRRLRRWYLVGNDYNWPRSTNAAARPLVRDSGGKVVAERYLPFGVPDFAPVLEQIAATAADAVLITLVGADSVQFNRQFAAAGLQKKVVRFGTLIEENTLAGIGAASSENLYASSGYFASLRTRAARDFASLYETTYGANAPLLNDLALSCYEGVRLLAVMGSKAGSLEVDRLEAIAQWQIADGPRGMTVLNARHAIRDVYLAKAEPSGFEVLKTFEAVRAAQTCEVDAG